MRRNPTGREVSDSRAYYPAVGLLLGLGLVGLERGAREVFPVYLTAAALLVFLVGATRALHLDGFMDICDGLFGAFTRQRRLEIMRDPNVGAFAVAGAASLLLLKYGALVSLLTIPAPGKEWTLLLFPMLSRWAMVEVVGAFPYVHPGGLGSPFHQEKAKLATLAAASTALAASVLLGSLGGVGLLLGISAVAWLMGRAITSLLGGLTGDAYGATNEVAEVAALVAAVAVLPYRWLEPLPQLLGGL